MQKHQNAGEGGDVKGLEGSRPSSSEPRAEGAKGAKWVEESEGLESMRMQAQYQDEKTILKYHLQAG